MCGRFGIEPEYVQLALHYQAVLDEVKPGPRGDLAPRSQVPVLVLRDGKRLLTSARWGLIPHWAADVRIGDKLFNARAETVATLPSFRDCFRRSRCVIPASCFYEWHRADGRSVPYVIRRVDGEPMSFAGLVSRWQDRRTGEVVESCTIITTTSNAALAPIHHRMPVILAEDTLAAWLEPAQDVARLQSLLRPCPDDWLIVSPVPPVVSRPHDQGPELIVSA